MKAKKNSIFLQTLLKRPAGKVLQMWTSGFDKAWDQDIKLLPFSAAMNGSRLE